MGLFDRKPKKDDSKATKQQNEEERIKKELETLAAILDKTDAQEKPAEKASEKPTMKPIAAAPEEKPIDKPAEKINILKPVVKPAVKEAPKEAPRARQIHPSSCSACLPWGDSSS